MLTVTPDQLCYPVHQPAKMTGYKGLLTAVIFRALIDLVDADPGVQVDALDYFNGPIFPNDLELLGLDKKLLPIGVNRQ